MRRLKTLTSLVGLVGLMACGGGDKTPTPAAQTKEVKTPAPPAPAEPSTPAPTAAPAAAPAAAATRTLKPDAEGIVRLTGDDMMRFNADRIEVVADQPVKLELHHVGKLPAAAMGHNVVILKPGTDPMAFGAAAVAAKTTGYVPPDRQGDVIAHSKVVGGGEKVIIEFNLPGPGTYPFLCSFPGHVAVMKGVLVAE